jgi:hypothetical protein
LGFFTPEIEALHEAFSANQSPQETPGLARLAAVGLASPFAPRSLIIQNTRHRELTRSLGKGSRWPESQNLKIFCSVPRESRDFGKNRGRVATVAYGGSFLRFVNQRGLKALTQQELDEEHVD